MKAIIVLIALLILGAIGYGIYTAGTISDFFHLPTKTIGEKQQFIKEMQNPDAYVQKISSGAEQLLQSGKQLLDEKKNQAADYIQEQKEKLKQEAENAVQDAAKKKIESIFSGM